MRLVSRPMLSIAALAVLPVTHALAADYDPPIYVEEAPEYVPVEIGSGWYLRGDVGYSIDDPYKNSTFGSGGYSIVLNESAQPVTASFGIGYHFNDFLRAEANVGTLPYYKAGLNYLTVDANNVVESNVDVEAKNRMWSGIVNVYGDLGTVAGFTPYVGAGVGMVSSKRRYHFHQNFADTNIVDYDFVDSKRNYSFAYTLGAGVAYNVSKNLAIDVGYQYMSAPDAEHIEITGPASYAVHKGVDFHQVKVGLRYSLW